MGFIFSSLDSADGASFKAQGPGEGQLNNAYGQTQQGIAAQNDFAKALAAQGGIGNQSNVFAQQQALADQLQGITDGTGPNPALAQLANTTGQNVAQQAALMGSQRGASQNAGLLARQIGQQGAGIQQQSAGQAAALAAQQQFNSIGALQQQQQMMGNLATQQVGQQQNALTGYNQFAQGQQQNLISHQGNANSANATIAAQNAKTQGQATGGILSGLSSVMAGAGAVPGMAHGGQVRHYDIGGTVVPDAAPVPTAAPPPDAPNSPTGPRSQLVKSQNKINYGSGPVISTDGDAANWFKFGENLGKIATGKGIFEQAGKFVSSLMSSSPIGGTSAMGGPAAGEGAAGAGEAGGLAEMAPMLAMLNSGGPVSGEALGLAGKKVPGKAKVKGDSLKNDTVDAKLSPGEIVIPRSHAMDPDKAAAFARAVVMNSRKKAK